MFDESEGSVSDENDKNTNIDLYIAPVYLFICKVF